MSSFLHRLPCDHKHLPMNCSGLWIFVSQCLSLFAMVNFTAPFSKMVFHSKLLDSFTSDCINHGFPLCRSSLLVFFWMRAAIKTSMPSLQSATSLTNNASSTVDSGRGRDACWSVLSEVSRGRLDAGARVLASAPFSCKAWSMSWGTTSTMISTKSSSRIAGGLNKARSSDLPRTRCPIGP